MRNLKKELQNNDLFYSLYLKLRQMTKGFLVSDIDYIKRDFKKRVGRDLNLSDPVKYNDKLQWLKVYWRDPLAVKCADKFEVRQYISNLIGSEYLNDLYGVYDSIEDIDLDSLPNSFVLKGTHGSGLNIICADKSKIDWRYQSKIMKRWLNTNYFWENREWVYKDIRPRIICEKYIEQEENEELRDYRFFCFNGQPKIIAVDLNINNKNKTRRNLYDLEWNLLDAEISYPNERNIIIKKPSKLEEMINLSRIISKPFPHARIDFYQINNKVIFGEITFFHQNGMGIFKPEEFEEEVGRLLKLPKPIIN